MEGARRRKQGTHQAQIPSRPTSKTTSYNEGAQLKERLIGCAQIPSRTNNKWKTEGDGPPNVTKSLSKRKRPCWENQGVQEVAEGRGGCIRDTRVHPPRP